MSQERKKQTHTLVQEITNLLFLLLAAVNRHGPLILSFLLQKETLSPGKKKNLICMARNMVTYQLNIF